MGVGDITANILQTYKCWVTTSHSYNFVVYPAPGNKTH